jgi:hypothetical protein
MMFLGILGSLLGFSSCIGEDLPTEQKEVVSVGDRVPDFEVMLSDGSRFSSRSGNGEIKMIAFFDTDCSDCQRFLPELQQLFGEVRREGGRIDKVSVKFCVAAREQTSAQVQHYWNLHSFTMPYYAPANRSLYHQFARVTVPRVYLVNPEGVIVAAFADQPIPTYEVLRRAIGRLTHEFASQNAANGI